MQTNFRSFIVTFFVFVALCEVSADCSDSLICCNRMIEILIIAGVIAVCAFFFVQCIIIVCLAHKLKKVEKRLDLVSFSRGSYKFQSQYPGLSFHEKALEETEDMNVNPRARRFSGLPPSTAGASKLNPIAIFDNPNANDKEIWGLY
ncbi:hypothetical protein OS493_022430 [Desmophyllum pertusum]|uniref:Uncharacterized protein n=1 Tax=Desmophyllum pertusum TaxID=174260 RepID=A0A9W9ZP19_9CNID|nr:hypothetical protein OS493_022430 [Desmophyllum pertusum]